MQKPANGTTYVARPNALVKTQTPISTLPCGKQECCRWGPRQPGPEVLSLYLTAARGPWRIFPLQQQHAHEELCIRTRPKAKEAGKKGVKILFTRSMTRKGPEFGVGKMITAILEERARELEQTHVVIPLEQYRLRRQREGEEGEDEDPPAQWMEANREDAGRAWFNEAELERLTAVWRGYSQNERNKIREEELYSAGMERVEQGIRTKINEILSVGHRWRNENVIFPLPGGKTLMQWPEGGIPPRTRSLWRRVLDEYLSRGKEDMLDSPDPDWRWSKYLGDIKRSL